MNETRSWSWVGELAEVAIEEASPELDSDYRLSCLRDGCGKTMIILAATEGVGTMGSAERSALSIAIHVAQTHKEQRCDL